MSYASTVYTFHPKLGIFVFTRLDLKVKSTRQKRMTTPVFPQIGMGPDVWGPLFWSTMHIVTLGYSETPSKEEQEAAVQFFNSLAIVIPCPICREHYAHFLETSPVNIAAKSRTELIHWLFILHNNVNVQLGKRKISWEEFIATMSKLRDKGSVNILAESSNASLHPAAWITGGILLGVVGYYFTYNHIVKPK